MNLKTLLVLILSVGGWLALFICGFLFYVNSFNLETCLDTLEDNHAIEEYIKYNEENTKDKFFDMVGSDNFTVEMEFKLEPDEEIRDLFFKGDHLKKWFAITIRKDGQINTQYQDGNGSKVLWGTSNIKDGRWHIVKSEYIREGNGWKINHFVDGILENSTTHIDMGTFETDCLISLVGPYGNCYGGYLDYYIFDGDVRYLKIWHKGELILLWRTNQKIDLNSYSII